MSSRSRQFRKGKEERTNFTNLSGLEKKPNTRKEKDKSLGELGFGRRAEMRELY